VKAVARGGLDAIPAVELVSVERVDDDVLFGRRAVCERAIDEDLVREHGRGVAQDGASERVRAELDRLGSAD
jgi:hypothetical protein